ncbi:hypothetical protein ACOI1H_14695 [Loktanella sp. DJP18]|uniref:hypothetical protein n=1 Tax=Loktanella sp. DJP18 TaxID=3409788 RepID=UPI003BB4E356
MIVKTKVTYTVNGGDDITTNLSLDVPDGTAMTGDTARFTLMSKAADQLVDKGQICLTGFKILDEAVPA